MKPFLGYGWQPQIMAVEGRQKAILAGRTEVYDVVADPAETQNLGAGSSLSAALRKALDDYPCPSPEAARAPRTLTDEARRSLASLGYVSASAPPVVRKDAPRPADMVGLFDVLEKASALFVQEQYAQVIPLLEKILARTRTTSTPHFGWRPRTPRSATTRRRSPRSRRRAAIAPSSPDVRTYLALHYARGKRLAAGGAAARAHRGRDARAAAGRRSARGCPRASGPVRGGDRAPAEDLQRCEPRPRRTSSDWASSRCRRSRRRSPSSRSSRRARSKGAAFAHDLELGVLYLAARRFTDARDALDRVAAVASRVPDGALQARAGERAAERA